jgi:hypothetical protein
LILTKIVAGEKRVTMPVFVVPLCPVAAVAST